MKSLLLSMIVVVAIETLSFAQKQIGPKANRTFSFSNEEYSPRKYNKILVNSGLYDPKSDMKVMKEFFEIGITAVSTLGLISPVKKYTDEDLKKIYQENQIDGIITLETKKEDKSGLYAMKQGQYKLTLLDLKSNLIAVTYEGRTGLSAYSSALDPDKTVVKFVRMIINDLKIYMQDKK